jgi:hypothetical protein
MRGNPLLEEGMRTYFAHRGILRSYLLIPCGLAVVMMAAWPRSSLETILRSGPSTDAFSVIALAFLALMLYLGARYGAEDFSPDTLVQLREYVTMTPVSLLSVVLGKAAFFILHTLFLLLLGVPFLLAPMAVGGFTLPTAFAVLAVVGTASLAARMFGFLVLALIGSRLLLRDVIILAGILLFIVAADTLVPAVSSIRALLRLSAAPAPGAPLLGSALSPAGACSLFNIAAALLCSAAAFLALRVSRRRAPAGGRSDG